MWHRTIDCLGVSVSVASPLDAIRPALEALLRTYAESSAPPVIAYELRRAAWPRLTRDGVRVVQTREELDLVSRLELDLYTQVMSRADGLLVHAGAVVGAHEAAIVVAGRSGSGKSTLVRALLTRGFHYLTEECVAFVGDRRCRGLARSLHVDDDHIDVPAGFTFDDYVIPRHDHVTRSRLFHPPAHAVWRSDARAAALVLIDHFPDANDSLTSVSGGETLLSLWPLVFRRDPAALADASTGLAGVPAYTLRTRSPESALARVLALAEELGIAP